MKIGIFLAFPPGTTVKNQGIHRLLTFLLKGLSTFQNIEPTLAFPAWLASQIKELLQDAKIEHDKINYLTTKNIPFILRIASIFSSLQKNKSFSLSFSHFRFYRRNLFIFKIYNLIYKKEVKKLIKKIHNSKDIHIWYTPAFFWPECNAIHNLKTVAAPDCVFVTHPLLYSTPFYHAKFNTLKKTLTHHTGNIICYSDFVKNEHLIKYLQLSADKIFVIRHASVNLMEFLLSGNLPASICLTTRAINILHTYRDRHMLNDHYIKYFDFTSLRFIFYSSQARPHKNILNLVKAYEYLLRKKYVSIKLILTAKLSDDEKLQSYIEEKRLQKDVLFLYNVTSEVLAALNHLAICAVNPTLFEGGFPFTFTEAYSVGTPSIMSAIPVTLEEITDTTLRSCMLFNPYHYLSIAEKIAWAISHRKELLQMQKSLYEKISNRSWTDIARQHIMIFTQNIAGEHYEPGSVTTLSHKHDMEKSEYV